MSEGLDMTKKYQEHYNSILSGTLSDTIIKSISYQANIKLANDVIAENEKMIKDLQDEVKKTKEESDKFKSELESLKSNRNQSENVRISTLEKNIKDQSETISKLNTTIYELNRFKTEYENVKNQVQHVDTFRNELEKARQQLKQQQTEHDKKVEEVRKSYESKLIELNQRIDYLQLTPAKRKKVDAGIVTVTTVEPEPVITKAKIIKQDVPQVVIKKDGGSF